MIRSLARSAPLLSGDGSPFRPLVLRRLARLEGSFDKLVSIEMVEAVGAEHLDGFFRVCSERLRPGGAMLLQAITIADRHYESALGRVDFIQRHVFPGSFIPSVAALIGAAARSSTLTPIHLEDLGMPYARTLAAWRERLLRHRRRAATLGLADRFLRLWEFDLAYCEGGYREQQLGDVQILFAGPEHGRTAVLGSIGDPR